MFFLPCKQPVPQDLAEQADGREEGGSMVGEVVAAVHVLGHRQCVVRRGARLQARRVPRELRTAGGRYRANGLYNEAKSNVSQALDGRG